MPSDSGVGDAKEATADAIKQQAVKKAKGYLWKTIILPNLPFILAGLAILLIVGVIVLAIIGYVNKGSAGQSASQPSTAVTEQTTLANANEPDARNLAINMAAETMISSLKSLRDRATQDNNTVCMQKVKDLEMNLLSLTTNDPTNTVGPDVIENQLADMEKNKDNACNKYSRSLTDPRAALLKLNNIIITTTSPKLIISGKDKYYIRTHQVDERVLKALNYLVTPTSLGGAGFNKIKVRRIKSEYDSKGRQFSREWDFTSEEDRTISPHFSGQAVDISGIEFVNRQLYKKSIAKGKKTTAKPPVDIMVVRQSGAAGKGSGFSSPTSGVGSSFGELFQSQGIAELLNLMGEATGYDFSQLDIKEGDSLPQIVKAMGLVVLNQELGMEFEPNEDDSNVEKMYKNIGQKALAEYLNVPQKGLEGDTPDEVQINLGREIATERLGLAEGSLTGTSSDEILSSVGKRKIESQFGIRLGSLDYFVPSGDPASSFSVFIGQVLIEQNLNLPGGSFDPNSLAQIKEKVGAAKFDQIYKNPGQVDAILNLPSGQNYSSRFLAGMSPYTYKKAVGDSLLTSKVYNFVNHAEVEGYFTNQSRFSQGTTTLYTGAQTHNKQDEAWNLPEGSLGKVTQGDLSVYSTIGLDELSKILTKNPNERVAITQWLTSHKTLPAENIGYLYSSVLNELFIWTIDKISNPNQANINGLQSRLKIVNGYINSLGISDEKKQEQEKIKIELEEKLRIEGGDITQWVFLPEGQYNGEHGLPMDAISNIFRLNNGENVFYAIGANKVSDIADEQSAPNETAAQQGRVAKLNFLNKQRGDAQAKLDELIAKRDAGDNSLETAGQILLYEGGKGKIGVLGLWDKEISMDNANLQSNQNSKTKSSKSLGIDRSKVMDMVLGGNQASKELGASKVESSLGLPAGSILRQVISGDGNIGTSMIGASYIEEELGMPSGSFAGADMAELIQSAGGTDKLFSYFFPRNNTTEMIDALPIRTANEAWFKNIFNSVDVLFALDQNATYDLMAGNITPNQYAGKVGDKHLKDYAINTLTKNLNLEFGGYRLNDQDVKDLLNGNYLDVALKIGAKNIDDGLNLPIGTIKAMISNPSLDCRVEVSKDGQTQSCIENLLAVNGQEQLAHFMGIYGQASMSGNISEIIGQEKIEDALNQLHPTNPPLPNGWFTGDSLSGIVTNLNKLLYPAAANLAQYNNDGEKKIIQKFGFNLSQYSSLNAIKNIQFIENSEPYKIAKAIDDKLGISVGTTASFLRQEISTRDYKEKVQKAYVRDMTTELLYSQVPDDITRTLRKYGLTPQDVVEGISDPESLFSKSLFTMLSPQEISIITGLGIKLPIKGDFPENFSQKLVEQTLGLAEGSFSPNSSITDVMRINGSKKFAASFRLNLDYSLSESGIANFITTDVSKEGSSYWSDAGNIKRASIIDGLFKISDVTEGPTKMLLQGRISIADYLSLVQKYQFDKTNTSEFLQGFASYLITGDQESSETQTRMGYVMAAGLGYRIFKDPSSLRDPNTQLAVLDTLKKVGDIDVDDKLGFSPGTMEKLILHPDKSKSILMAQGMRVMSEKVFFGDMEGQKGNLLALFQYYIPEMDPGYIVNVNPRDPNNRDCASSSQNLSEEDAKKFVEEHKTLCSNLIINGTLRDVIERATTINDKNGNPIAGGGGIRLPDEDLNLLRKGDPKVMEAMSIAFTVNKLKAEKDENGDNFQILPQEFHLDYNDVKSVMWASQGEKDKAAWDAGDAYKKANPTVPPSQLPDGKPNPAYISYSDGLTKAVSDAQSNIVVEARKELQYKYFDAQLMSTAKMNGLPPVPPGFTKAMMSGNETERNNMLLAYGTKYVLANGLLPGPIKEADRMLGGYISTTLSNFVQDRDMNKLKAAFRDDDAMRNNFLNFVDDALSKKLGVQLPENTAANIYSYATTGKFKTEDFGQDFLQRQVSGLLDKQLGLKPGTAQGIYSVYKAYRAVEVAKKALEVAKLTGDATKILTAQANLNASQAGVITMGVELLLYAFSEELAKVDQNIGLPPGSTSSIISFATSYAVYEAFYVGTASAGTSMASFAAAGVWIAGAMMVYTILFGYSKVEMQMTCVGDRIYVDAIGNRKSWCKEDNALYVQWAQFNTRELINQMLMIGDRTGDNNLIPTILGTYRQEDVDYLGGKDNLREDLINKYYGRPSMARGVKGLYQSDYMSDFVHIGY